MTRSCRCIAYQIRFPSPDQSFMRRCRASVPSSALILHHAASCLSFHVRPCLSFPLSSLSWRPPDGFPVRCAIVCVYLRPSSSGLSSICKQERVYIDLNDGIECTSVIPRLSFISCLSDSHAVLFAIYWMPGLVPVSLSYTHASGDGSTSSAGACSSCSCEHAARQIDGRCTPCMCLA